ncbi:type II secretion system F family protein [Streptomyces brevispora]|uniref:Tight adherence protein B n=1 Tax=Streptomyces brevispora TaxID=887462 RepID=A0A561UXE3_9ACTN|nr:type II secretion system F family protein [Streptomyces brevispora]TWG04034.1 tight adherence protein B [Streptomyces brevispora]WSC14942.1 type II secretion system F family protein [Streptomyces brevispora]
MPEAVHAAALCAGAAAWMVVAGRSQGRRRARVLFGNGSDESPWWEERWESGRRRLEALLRGRREWLCLPVALLLGVLGESVLPMVAGAAAVPLVRRWLRRRELRKDRERRADGVMDLCGAVVGELRAGREPGQALLVGVGGTGVMGAAEAGVSAAARFGGDVPRALGQAAREPGLDGLAGVAACWRVAVDGGAGLAAGLDRLEGALRAERRRREELRAQLAGAWSTVAVLALLPVLGMGLGAALGAHPLRVLLHSTAGLVCLVMGGLLEAAGLLWAGRIVRAGEAV